MTPPREVISWDEYYMGLAYMNPVRSKDPSTQIGAFVVNANNEQLGMGYNGAPQAIPDNKIDWSRPNKYKYVVHAEKNAIRYAVAARGKAAVEGATIYVSAMPCVGCMLEIVTYRLGRVVYGLTSATMLTPEAIYDSLDMAKLGGVTVEKYVGKLTWLKDRVNWLEQNVPGVI